MAKEVKEPPEGGEKGLQSVAVSRRGFLKGLGTGTASLALTGVPVVLPPEVLGAPASAGVKEAVVKLNVNGAAYRLKVKSQPSPPRAGCEDRCRQGAGPSRREGRHHGCRRSRLSHS